MCDLQPNMGIFKDSHVWLQITQGNQMPGEMNEFVYIDPYTLGDQLSWAGWGA